MPFQVVEINASLGDGSLLLGVQEEAIGHMRKACSNDVDHGFTVHKLALGTDDVSKSTGVLQ